MTAYNLQRSNRNVSIKRASSDRGPLYSDAVLCHMEQLDQLQTYLQNAGNWAREVKPLMRQGKHSSDVCLLLPNVTATSGQHFTVAPCTSPITLLSM